MGKAANSANVLMCEFPLMVFFQKIQYMELEESTLS